MFQTSTTDAKRYVQIYISGHPDDFSFKEQRHIQILPHTDQSPLQNVSKEQNTSMKALDF